MGYLLFDKKVWSPILKFAKDHPVVFTAIVYLWVSLPYLAYEYSLFKSFGIKFFDYVEDRSLFLMAVNNIQSIVIFCLSLGYFVLTLVIYLNLNKFLKKKLKDWSPADEKIDNSSDMQSTPETKVFSLREGIKVSMRFIIKGLIALTKIAVGILVVLLILLLIIGPFGFSWCFGKEKAKEIKTNKKLPITCLNNPHIENCKTYIQTQTKPIGYGIDNDKFTMIRKAGNFIFVYNRDKKIPLAIPISAISTILVKNEENKESFEEILPINPNPKDEEILKLQKEIERKNSTR